MPADGISLPPKKGDFGTSRWGGSKVRLHQPRDWAEGHGHLWHIATVRCEAPIWSLMEA
jgi:hypothetical protein